MRDGWLVDVRGWGRQAGFQVPVAISAAAWNEAVASGDGVERRARNVLRAAAKAALDLAKLGEADTDRLVFTVDGASGEPGAEPVGLKLHIGPGDQGEPVFTILLPNED